MYLFGARQARFIDEVQTLAAVIVGGLALRKMVLQRGRSDARFFELIGGPRCGREAFHGVTFCLRRFAEGG